MTRILLCSHKPVSLFLGRRFFGAVIPDSKHPGMWRSPLASGRRSDMANLSWARHAVFEAAIRELEWEAQHDPAIAPPKCPENEGVFEPHRRRFAKTVPPLVTHGRRRNEPPAALPTPSISEIQIGVRHRRDLGDIEGLATSIAEIGLLHPITVDENGRLLAGARRLAACRGLGVEVKIVRCGDGSVR